MVSGASSERLSRSVNTRLYEGYPHSGLYSMLVRNLFKKKLALQVFTEEVTPQATQDAFW